MEHFQTKETSGEMMEKSVRLSAGAKRRVGPFGVKSQVLDPS
jgi:hypothetical protein